MVQTGVWIVAWDIPLGDKRNRAQFYYELKKLRKKYGMQNRLSSRLRSHSMLVLECKTVKEPPPLARAVHKLALKHGKSHVWWAHIIDMSTRVEK